MSHEASSNGGSGSIWDFLNDIPMDDFTGKKSEKKKPSDRLPAVRKETSSDPLHGYLPHNHSKFWEMLKLAIDSSHPDQVERSQRFFKQCPDGSCRKKLQQIFDNLESFVWEDDENEQRQAE